MSIKNILQKLNCRDTKLLPKLPKINKKIKFASMPKIGDSLAGFHIYFADPYKPSNWLPEKIKVIGEEYLTAKINNRNLDYGLLSFFQVNENIFHQR